MHPNCQLGSFKQTLLFVSWETHFRRKIDWIGNSYVFSPDSPRINPLKQPRG